MEKSEIDAKLIEILQTYDADLERFELVEAIKAIVVASVPEEKERYASDLEGIDAWNDCVNMMLKQWGDK